MRRSRFLGKYLLSLLLGLQLCVVPVWANNSNDLKNKITRKDLSESLESVSSAIQSRMSHSQFSKALGYTGNPVTYNDMEREVFKLKNSLEHLLNGDFKIMGGETDILPGHLYKAVSIYFDFIYQIYQMDILDEERGSQALLDKWSLFIENKDQGILNEQTVQNQSTLNQLNYQIQKNGQGYGLKVREDYALGVKTATLALRPQDQNYFKLTQYLVLTTLINSYYEVQNYVPRSEGSSVYAPFLEGGHSKVAQALEKVEIKSEALWLPSESRNEELFRQILVENFEGVATPEGRSSDDVVDFILKRDAQDQFQRIQFVDNELVLKMAEIIFPNEAIDPTSLGPLAMELKKAEYLFLKPLFQKVVLRWATPLYGRDPDSVEKLVRILIQSKKLAVGGFILNSPEILSNEKTLKSIMTLLEDQQSKVAERALRTYFKDWSEEAHKLLREHKIKTKYKYLQSLKTAAQTLQSIESDAENLGRLKGNMSVLDQVVSGELDRQKPHSGFNQFRNALQQHKTFKEKQVYFFKSLNEQVSVLKKEGVSLPEFSKAMGEGLLQRTQKHLEFLLSMPELISSKNNTQKGIGKEPFHQKGMSESIELIKKEKQVHGVLLMLQYGKALQFFKPELTELPIVNELNLTVAQRGSYLLFLKAHINDQYPILRFSKASKVYNAGYRIFKQKKEDKKTLEQILNAVNTPISDLSEAQLGEIEKQFDRKLFLVKNEILKNIEDVASASDIDDTKDIIAGSKWIHKIMMSFPSMNDKQQELVFESLFPSEANQLWDHFFQKYVGVGFTTLIALHISRFASRFVLPQLSAPIHSLEATVSPYIRAFTLSALGLIGVDLIKESVHIFAYEKSKMNTYNSLSTVTPLLTYSDQWLAQTMYDEALLNFYITLGMDTVLLGVPILGSIFLRPVFLKRALAKEDQLLRNFENIGFAPGHYAWDRAMIEDMAQIHKSKVITKYNEEINKVAESFEGKAFSISQVSEANEAILKVKTLKNLELNKIDKAKTELINHHDQLTHHWQRLSHQHKYELARLGLGEGNWNGHDHMRAYKGLKEKFEKGEISKSQWNQVEQAWKRLQETIASKAPYLRYMGGVSKSLYYRVWTEGHVSKASRFKGEDINDWRKDPFMDPRFSLEKRVIFNEEGKPLEIYTPRMTE